jgi:hypothetical protein
MESLIATRTVAFFDWTGNYLEFLQILTREILTTTPPVISFPVTLWQKVQA